MAFYVRGEDLKSLRANVNQLNALLLPNGLQPILHEADLLALDSYIRNLPMAYDARLDKIESSLAAGVLAVTSPTCCRSMAARAAPVIPGWSSSTAAPSRWSSIRCIGPTARRTPTC